MMDKEYLSFKTIWGALLIALGSVLPAFAQEDEAPAVERDTVLLSPLYFINRKDINIMSKHTYSKDLKNYGEYRKEYDACDRADIPEQH